jgi:hypothetical protein
VFVLVEFSWLILFPFSQCSFSFSFVAAPSGANATNLSAIIIQNKTLQVSYQPSTALQEPSSLYKALRAKYPTFRGKIPENHPRVTALNEAAATSFLTNDTHQVDIKMMIDLPFAVEDEFVSLTFTKGDREITIPGASIIEFASGKIYAIEMVGVEKVNFGDLQANGNLDLEDDVNSVVDSDVDSDL